jgi:protein-disulfide isomerase
MSLPQRFITGGVFVLSALVLGACQPVVERVDSGEATDTRTAGTIGDQEVSVSELDLLIKDELFKQASKGGDPSELYALRQSHFHRLANQRLLEEEAAAQGMKPEELIFRESSRDIQVEDAQIRALYDANAAQFQGRGYEEVASLIQSHLERQAREANAERFLAGLRDRGQVEFSLAQTRIDIVGSGPSVGDEQAPVTIVEFSDYQCPYCKRAEGVVSEVRRRYPDHVRFEFRHFPLEQIHPRARAAAEAAICAETQDRFWAFHGLVFAEGETDLSDERLLEYAGSAGLDLDAFSACVAERSGKGRVDRDLDAGKEAGVNGTPTFFVNGLRVVGGGSADDFAKIIDKELERLRASEGA